MDISGIHSTYDFSHIASGRNASSNSTVNDEKNVSDKNTPNAEKTQNGQELTLEEQKKVEELKKRDQEVRDHEQAHQRAGGSLARPPQYEFETGPDGKQYAVSGHVDIDTSKGKTPEETIQRAETIIQAAHAPKDPSAQDLKVAREAQQLKAEAQQELQKKQQDALAEITQNQTNESETDKSAVAATIKAYQENQIESISLEKISASDPSSANQPSQLAYQALNFFG